MIDECCSPAHPVNVMQVVIRALHQLDDCRVIREATEREVNNHPHAENAKRASRLSIVVDFASHPGIFVIPELDGAVDVLARVFHRERIEMLIDRNQSTITIGLKEQMKNLNLQGVRLPVG